MIDQGYSTSTHAEVRLLGFSNGPGTLTYMCNLKDGGSILTALSSRHHATWTTLQQCTPQFYHLLLLYQHCFEHQHLDIPSIERPIQLNDRHNKLLIMPRRQHLTLMLVVGAAIFLTLTYFISSSSSSPIDPFSPSAYDNEAPGNSKPQTSTPMGAVDFAGLGDILSGGSIAPKLGNETLKYVALQRSPSRKRPSH